MQQLHNQDVCCIHCFDYPNACIVCHTHSCMTARRRPPNTQSDVDLDVLNAILHGANDDIVFVNQAPAQESVNSIEQQRVQIVTGILNGMEQVLEDEVVLQDVDVSQEECDGIQLNDDNQGGQLNEIYQWFSAHGAPDLYDNFKDFRCIGDVMLIKEEEFGEVGIVAIQDKMAMRRLIGEYHQKLQSVPVAQIGQQVEEEEMKRLPQPAEGDIQQYFRFGFFSF